MPSPPRPPSRASRPAQPTSGIAIERRLRDTVNSRNLHQRGPLLEIPLWTKWTQMLTDLPAWGEVLIVSRNSAAVLGSLQRYPRIDISDDEHHGRSPNGAFDLDFPAWHSAIAVSERRADDFSHFVEFRDCAGEVIHKICLTDDSDADGFVDWVEFHQSSEIGSIRPGWIDPDRWRTVQQRHWFGIEDADDVGDSATLDAIFRAAMDRQMPLRIVTGNEGVVQSALLTPRRLHPSGGWTFVCDDVTGLHFDPEGITDVIVHHVPETINYAGVPIIKAFDDHGAICLAVMPPCSCVIPRWLDLLKSTIPKL
jgi:putative heme degradation protein